MASIETSGAGDGPANPIDSSWKNTSSPSPWTNLPLTVCAVLAAQMNTEGLRTMRQVCTQWLNNVEEGVGLKVKVDDREEGNLDFVKRVRVRSARVRNWTEDIGSEPASRLFQCPGWLKKLKLSGKMPVQWKIHYLQQFPNLAHLVLRDSGLYSNNLSGHQYPVLPNFDLTSQLSPDAVIRRAYQKQDPPSEAQPIELKNLRTLEFVLFDSRFDVLLPTHSYFVMTANICFILSHVTSPLLSVVNLTLEQPYSISLKKKLTWTLEPLHKFLNSHRTTLRQVIVACETVKSSDLIEDESLSNLFPVNLRKLRLIIIGPRHDMFSADPPIQTTFNYLQKCLQGQTQLQDVKFNFYSFPVKWISDAFTALANSCGQTLRYLELRGYPNDSTSLDLEILSVCRSLQVLHVSDWVIGVFRPFVAFRNADKLPISLKRLVIHCGEAYVEIGDPSFFESLTVLEWLCLNKIRPPAAANNGNQEPEWSFCRTLIKSLLGLRQLQGFDLQFESILNRDQNLVSMLSPLNPAFNEATTGYLSGRANFNLDFNVNGTRPAVPWSDKPFDKSKWDLEKLQDDERPQVEQDSDNDGDDNDDPDGF